MPAPIPPASLKQVAPTQEEVDEARKLISGFKPNEQRSKMGSIVAWLKGNPDGNEGVLDSRKDFQTGLLYINRWGVDLGRG